MKTVYVGLSGGVDSSVAAYLLKERGYRVVGVYMKNWTAPVAGADCPWRQDLADAQAVAVRLDIPFKVFDFQKEYKQKVVDVMVEEYRAGRTPNPDVLCNQEIKFRLFHDAAIADGADLIATGHYARVEDGKLLAGKDPAKDQSYFLYRMPVDALKDTLMPIGELTKPEVRQIAGRLGLPTASKPDSQGICFVGEVGIKDFLRQYIPGRSGDVVRLSDRKVVGRHDGAEFVTIGQRHGLGIGGGKPYFVCGKDMQTATVFVTDDAEDDLLRSDRLTLSHGHWLNKQPDPEKVYRVRVRYRAELVQAKISSARNGWKVDLMQPERAITCGQSLVVYDGDRVVGGGIIESVPQAVVV